MFFSKSTPLEMQSEIMEELGESELKQYEAYLGLPALVGRNKRARFDSLKKSVEKITRVGWKIIITSKERSPNQISHSSNTDLCDELF